MESGLEDRNNSVLLRDETTPLTVSMESGLEDRNNKRARKAKPRTPQLVSMESGLEDRNNAIEQQVEKRVGGSQWSPA